MKKYIAEFIGAFGIVFFGTGAIIVSESQPNLISNFGIALSFGLTVAVMIYSFAEISGAHFNPAVTVGFWAKDKIGAKEAGLYLISQISGASAASLILHTLIPKNEKLGAALPSGTELQSFILEIMLTLFLMLVILQTAYTGQLKSRAGLLIGGTVFLEALFFGPISGASMNPARSLGPALISGNYHELWIYIAGPLTGALSASAIHNVLILEGKPLLFLHKRSNEE